LIDEVGGNMDSNELKIKTISCKDSN